MARIGKEKVQIAVRYALLDNGWTDKSTFEDVLGEWSISNILSGTPSMSKVVESANGVLSTFGLKTQLTVLDVVEARWGFEGLDAYYLILDQSYQEIADMKDRSDEVIQTWRQLNKACAKIEKKVRDKNRILSVTPWHNRIRYDRNGLKTV